MGINATKEADKSKVHNTELKENNHETTQLTRNGHGLTNLKNNCNTDERIKDDQVQHVAPNLEETNNQAENYSKIESEEDEENLTPVANSVRRGSHENNDALSGKAQCSGIESAVNYSESVNKENANGEPEDGSSFPNTLSADNKEQFCKHIKEQSNNAQISSNKISPSQEPTFFIGGFNGAAIIEDVCKRMGWKRIYDRSNCNFRLKWCEFTSHINYASYKEGIQMVNHIPNNHLLTNKLGLLKTLQKYDRICQSTSQTYTLLDFIPETFCLDNAIDRRAFRDTFKDGTLWICKPTGTNQGRGIFIVKSQKDVNKIFEEQMQRARDGKVHKPLNRIIQRYLTKPLLLNRKKFDIRCYMLIASTCPYMVLYHKGYARLCILDYDANTENKVVHLTNQFIQKKDPTYKHVKDDTTWSMERLNEYVNQNYSSEKGIVKDWVLNVLPTRMKQIMMYCFKSVKSQLQCKVGYHDLYGFDFLIDEDMKVWLIEVNVNPSLATDCVALKKVVPSVVKETIHIANECFEKSRSSLDLLPLRSMKGFQILYHERKLDSSRTDKKLTTSRVDTKLAMPRVDKKPATSRVDTKVPPPYKSPTIYGKKLDHLSQGSKRQNSKHPISKK